MREGQNLVHGNPIFSPRPWPSASLQSPLPVVGAQLWIILRLQSAWSLLLHAYVRILSIELTEVPNFLPHSQAYTTLALYLDSIHLDVLSG